MKYVLRHVRKKNGIQTTFCVWIEQAAYTS